MEASDLLKDAQGGIFGIEEMLTSISEHVPSSLRHYSHDAGDDDIGPFCV